MAERRRIGFFAPMPIELRPLVRGFGLQPSRLGDLDVRTGSVGDTEVVAIQAGIGTKAAVRSATRLLDATSLDHVVVVGVAGGVAPSIGIADLVLPEKVIDGTTGEVYDASPFGTAVLRGTIRTSDDLTTAAEIDDLVAQGITALDMETGCIAAECDRRGVPWTAFRSISDRISDGLLDDTIMGMMRPDGSVDAGAAARVVARRPWIIPRFAKMGRWANRAAKAAADAAIGASREWATDA